ncbi:MAG: ABC transporter permease [Actinobacteria bacterium]|nr:ABC transporter permease [Actinomycetota bacterium]
MKALKRATPITWARLAVFVGVFLAFALIDGRFATVNNVYTIFEGFAWLGLGAMAVGITIIAGEFDLSVGSAAAVAGILSVKFIGGLGLLPTVILVGLIGMAFGAMQGWLIYRLRIASLVFTLGSLIALRGLAYMISNERTVVMQDLEVAKAVKRQLFIFSPFSLTTIAIFVVIGLFLRYHRYGREVFAVGGGRNEAIAAGVPLARPLITAFALSGTCAALTGALSTIKSGSASPFGFEQLLLPAVTAALIGGVSLFGGKGTAPGIAVGALTIRFLNSGLSLRGSPYYVITLATGTLLIVVVLLELVLDRPELRDRIRLRRLRRAMARETGAG